MLFILIGFTVRKHNKGVKRLIFSCGIVAPVLLASPACLLLIVAFSQVWDAATELAEVDLAIVIFIQHPHDLLYVVGIDFFLKLRWQKSVKVRRGGNGWRGWYCKDAKVKTTSPQKTSDRVLMRTEELYEKVRSGRNACEGGARHVGTQWRQ